MVILALFTVFEASNGTLAKDRGEEIVVVEEVVPDEFSEENLKKYIEVKGIKHPEIVYAQAVLETGKFSSTIFKENHNLFGMKYVHTCGCRISGSNVRPTTAIGSRYGHARYQHWKKSVDDYLLWQKMFKRTPIETREEYFKLLGRSYAESKQYVSILKWIMEQGEKKVEAPIANLKTV